MVKKKCHICGAELSENDVICPKCGSYVEEPAYDAISDMEDVE